MTKYKHVGIKELLDNPFSMHPLHDKLRIVKKCRTTPTLINLITFHQTTTEQYNVQAIFVSLNMKRLTR
jgi:hypothetical protein